MSEEQQNSEETTAHPGVEAETDSTEEPISVPEEEITDDEEEEE